MRALRVLLIEDSEDDAGLLLAQLATGFCVEADRVQTAAGVAEALARRRFDLVISDFNLPGFSAHEAFRLIRDKGIDVPFIIVSGTIGEDVAVEAMRAGVHDYLLKDNLSRLVPAVEREIREAAGRASRSKMQEQLVIAEKMAAVGTMAAGVAHEINNPLASLLANLDLLGQRTDDSDLETTTLLQEIREAAERVKVIASDLRMFFRTHEERTGPVDVVAVMDSAARLARNEIRHRARLVRRYAGSPRAEANASRIAQVFLNLLINAAQAMPEGRADANEIVVTIEERGPDVLIEVRDTGMGMPPEVQAKIFDPFFTTKPLGVGTGLGLTICHRIVTEAGGSIEVESTPGVSTTVRVRLPTAKRTAPVATPVPTSAEPTKSDRPGRVLVIDDEPMIARALKRLLSKHDVTCCQRATEGLELLRSGAPFDVILCDMMMPEMGGIDFYEELKTVAPAMVDRVVLMTGGAFSSNARAFLERVPNPRLEKPFEAETLRSVVARFLPAGRT